MFIQILKFPVDYFSINWFGYNKAVFWYFDISYYIQNMSVNGYQSVLIFTLTMITLYWMVCITLFLTKYKASETIANVRRLILLFVSTIFYLPILNIILTYIINNLVYLTAVKVLFFAHVLWKTI